MLNNFKCTIKKYIFNNKKGKKMDVSLKNNKDIFINDMCNLIQSTDDNTINELIKFMANSVQCELATKTFYNSRNYPAFMRHIEYSFLIDTLQENSIRYGEFKIDISKTPIISCVWNHKRIINNLKGIGKCVGNPFDGEKNKINIRGILISPLNLVIIYNGNHSVNSAIIHNEGELYVDRQVDISPVLNKYYFDGENYIDNTTGKKIENDYLLDGSKPFTYTIGLLFEIARIINKNKDT